MGANWYEEKRTRQLVSFPRNVFLRPLSNQNMRVGFVSCLTNDFDAKPIIQELASGESNVTLEFLQAPTLLNVPASFKKLFSLGVDACIAFVQSSEEERASLALAQEKAVDVEIECGKYSLICTVLDDEKEMGELVKTRLHECIQLLMGVQPPKPMSFETPLDFFTSGAPSLDVFSTTSAESPQASSSDSKSLF